MAALYVNRALQAENLKNAVTESDLPAVCVAGDAEAFCKTVNRFFLNMDYAFANAIDKEAHCAGFVHMIALVQGLDCRCETHNAFGRSDLAFDAGGFHWVIEFKFSASAEEAPAKAAEALAQIKARHYGEQSALSGRRLLRLAMVYVKPERRCVMRLEEEAPAA